MTSIAPQDVSKNFFTMKHLVLSGFSILITVTGLSQGLFIANFEQQQTYTSLYHDLDDPNHPHPLLNNNQEPILNVVGVNNNLGFSAYYLPYDDPGTGLSDGDEVGVTNDTTTVGAFYEGNQGYVLSDIDGNYILTFSEVSLNPSGQNMVSCSLFIKESTYEGDGTQNIANSDRIAIYVINPTDGSKIDLIDTTGSDIDDLNIEGQWLTFSAEIPEFEQAQLVVEARNNASNEAFYIDDIRFDSTMSIFNHEASISAVVPNPINQSFGLTKRPSDLKEIYIQNIFGRIIWRGDANQNEWAIPELNSGLYFLNLTNKNRIYTQKIIKQ